MLNLRTLLTGPAHGHRIANISSAPLTTFPGGTRLALPGAAPAGAQRLAGVQVGGGGIEVEANGRRHRASDVADAGG